MYHKKPLATACHITGSCLRSIVFVHYTCTSLNLGLLVHPNITLIWWQVALHSDFRLCTEWINCDFLLTSDETKNVSNKNYRYKWDL